MPQLNYIEVETAPQPTASVIWLHGLGASGHDFEPIVPELKLPMAVRFIFPHAPNRPVTINGGMEMPAWYDLLSIGEERDFNHEHIMESSQAVEELIEQEISRGISSERIVIAGFSQGGAIAYQAGLSYSKPLAGVMALSTYFATKATLEAHSVNKQIPIFIAHGSMDDIVPEKLGQQAKAHLDDMGYSTEYVNYPMPHSVCLEEINDISSWLQRVLA